MELGKGILGAIDEGYRKVSYEPLTLENLKQTLKDVYENAPRQEIVVPMGLKQYNYTNFIVGCIGVLDYPFFTYIPKRWFKEDFFYLSIGKKHGNLKCKIMMGRKVSKIELLKGTQILGYFSHFHSVNKFIKENKLL